MRFKHSVIISLERKIGKSFPQIAFSEKLFDYICKSFTDSVAVIHIQLSGMAKVIALVFIVPKCEL